MRRKFIIPSLLSFALFGAGCTEDALENTPNIQDGDEIIFNVSASYGSSPQTRTEYGDVSQDGTSQEIYWTAGDQVTLYSPESGNTQQVSYNVNVTTGSNKGTLSEINPEDVGLQWGSGTQSFYAIYPSVEMIQGNNELKNYSSFKEGKLSGYIPVNQQHTITKGGKTGWTAKPNMDYSWMVAKTTVSKEDRANGVKLDFSPISTTLEVTINGPTDVYLNALNIRCKSGEHPIAGKFECDLTQTNDAEGWECTYPASQELQSNITIPLYYREGSDYKPIKLGANESITFNVFLLPSAAHNDIEIRLSGLNTSSKGADLNALGVAALQPHKKTIIKTPAPVLSGGTNQWITNIPDNVLVSQLSIPGTANSFSANYFGSHPEWYETQTSSVAEQLNAGIRCFELRGAENGTTAYNFGSSILQCNRTSIGVTFSSAFSQFETFLANNPDEFIMIIPSYESNSGLGGAVTYLKGLNAFMESKERSTKFVTYSKELTVGEARGGFIVISRITSEEYAGTDEETQIQNEDISVGVLIDQWGSLKDNWARRGYTLDGVKVPNWAKNADWDDENSMEYWMVEGNTSSKYTPSKFPERVEANVDFIHSTKRSDGSSGQAYIHEWARVVPETKNYQLYWGQYAYWQESMTEKKNDVWNTFLKAIEENSQETANSFYINSLDGYYVDENIAESYNPYVEGRNTDGHSFTAGGTAGNIKEYANDINNYFYNQILTYGEDNIYGPMNIVLMDMVLDGTDGGEPTAGDLLPQIIIDNNFKFPLRTRDDATPSTNNGLKGGGNTSMGNGGSVWK